MDIRCAECSSHPLMAKLHHDKKGSPYIHVKIYKAGRVYGEVVVTKGSEVWLRCRECKRWHLIKIATMEISNQPLPDTYERVT